MSNNSLAKFERNGLEFWVDEATGLAYANLLGIQRMLSLNDNRTLRRRLGGVANKGEKTDQVQTGRGMQRVALYPASVVFKLAIEFKKIAGNSPSPCGWG